MQHLDTAGGHMSSDNDESRKHALLEKIDRLKDMVENAPDEIAGFEIVTEHSTFGPMSIPARHVFTRIDRVISEAIVSLQS